MKKVLLSLSLVFAATASFAQVDTLTEFFTGSPTIYQSSNGGYVSGNNGYDDLAKYMRFDATNGIIGGGALTGVVMWIPVIEDNGGSFDVVVRDYSGGTLGSVLASQTLTIASVDTSAAAIMVAEGAVGYNVAVTFATPVIVNASSDILVGVELPTTAGDTIALISNTDGDFADGDTYSWEVWSDNSLNAIGDPNNWDLMIAFGIHPVINFVAGLGEETLVASAYPNPASTELNIKITGNATNVTILSMDGKVMSSEVVNGNMVTVNVADLTAGVYFYEVTAQDGTVVRNTFMKK